MAKQSKSDPEQLALIDTEEPKFKPVKAAIKKYEKIKEEKKVIASEWCKKEQEQRKTVLSSMQEADIKPDAEGAYHFPIDGKDWVISQDSQIKIKKHSLKDDDSGDDDAGEDFA